MARTRLSESLKLAQELGDRLRIAAALEGFGQATLLEGAPSAALQLTAVGGAIF